MKAYEIVGWTYDADCHCCDCAYARFGRELDDEDAPPADSEGNEVRPIFAGDEWGGDGCYCGDCGEAICGSDEVEGDER